MYKTNLSESGLRGFSPALIIERIVPAFPFPSYCMFSAALCKPGAEQPKRESEMGLGLRKKRLWNVGRSGMPPGKGTAGCTGGAAAWTRVKKGDLKHLTYKSHGVSWWQFGVKHCWLQLQRQALGKSFCFMGVLDWFTSFFSTLKIGSLMEGGISTKSPVLYWKGRLAWKPVIHLRMFNLP